MTIEEFERQVKELLTYTDRDGISWLRQELVMYLHKDGCLGAEWKGVSIPCEELPWDKALDEIVAFLKERAS